MSWRRYAPGRPGAAVTNDHTAGGSEQLKLIFSQIWRPGTHYWLSLDQNQGMGRVFPTSLSSCGLQALWTCGHITAVPACVVT